MKPSLNIQSAPEDDEGDEIRIADLLTQVLARKWLVIACTLAGVLIGVFIGQLPPDQYRASALVHLERRTQGIQLPEILVGTGFSQSGGQRIATESHIIRSRFTLGPVADALNLDWRLEPRRFPVIGHMAERRAWPQIPNWIAPQYTRYGDSITLGLLEVDQPLVNRRATLTVTGPDRFEARLRGFDAVTGRVGETVQPAPGFRFRIAQMSLPEGRVLSLWRSGDIAATGRVRRGLRISERAPRNSGIIDFIYIGGDRDLSVDVANAVTRSYQRQNLNRRAAEIDQSVAFIEEQIPQAREATARAAEALRAFREKSGNTELTVGADQLLKRIIGIEAELEELRFREEQLLQRLTENHPEVRSLRDQMSRLEDRLVEMRVEADELPPIEQELLTLQQNLQRTVEIERQLANRAEELNIVRASAVSNVNILEPAVRAAHIGPDRRRPIFAGLALGLVLSVMGVLGLNFMRRGIDDSRAIEQLGLPLFATINRVDGLRSGGAESDLYALARSSPDDIVVEALRGLRTGLQFALATAPGKSLMITSPAPSLGKSFISLNLAIVSAQVGSRVLLIDADMRKGRLRHHFGLPRKHMGLSDYLSKGVTLDEVLVTDPEISLDFIPTGSHPPNSADLLTTKAFRDLLSEASDHYDLVIVDCPPVLAVTDPGIVGQKTGMSLLIVKHLETTVAEIQSSQKILANTGVTLSGAVLNQFDAAASRYGQYGHKYGYYGGYKYHYK